MHELKKIEPDKETYTGCNESFLISY